MQRKKKSSIIEAILLQNVSDKTISVFKSMVYFRFDTVREREVFDVELMGVTLFKGTENYFGNHL